MYTLIVERLHVNCRGEIKMGRGLSELQKKILLLAYPNTDSFFNISHDILWIHGISNSYVLRKLYRPLYMAHGSRKENRAAVIVSRSLKRLRARGLLDDSNRLTDKGYEVVVMMRKDESVAKATNIGEVNRVIIG